MQSLGIEAYRVQKIDPTDTESKGEKKIGIPPPTSELQFQQHGALESRKRAIGLAGEF